MGKVHEFMSADLIAVEPGLSLRNLVELFAQRHISGAPVVDGRRVVGVVSVDDVLNFLASQPTVPKAEEGKVEQDEDLPVDQWSEGDEPPSAFFVDTWDNAGGDVAERFDTADSPEWDLLGEHTVEEAMSRRIVAVGHEESVAEAARKMEQAQVHRLLVMDGGSLLGIITTSDVTRAVAESRA